MPYRPLVADAAKGIGAPALDGNLVIHGDNLQALKSLLPRHAGGVDLIFSRPSATSAGRPWAHWPCAMVNLRWWRVSCWSMPPGRACLNSACWWRQRRLSPPRSSADRNLLHRPARRGSAWIKAAQAVAAIAGRRAAPSHKAVALGHADGRQTLGIECRVGVEQSVQVQQVGAVGLAVVIAERARRLQRHGPAQVVEDRRGKGPELADGLVGAGAAGQRPAAGQFAAAATASATATYENDVGLVIYPS